MKYRLPPGEQTPSIHVIPPVIRSGAELKVFGRIKYIIFADSHVVRSHGSQSDQDLPINISLGAGGVTDAQVVPEVHGFFRDAY